MSLDFTLVFTNAYEFVNNMWPIMVIPIGLLLGVGILNFIVRALKSALTSL